jgi:hypothetical protein
MVRVAPCQPSLSADERDQADVLQRILHKPHRSVKIGKKAMLPFQFKVFYLDRDDHFHKNSKDLKM